MPREKESREPEEPGFEIKRLSLEEKKKKFNEIAKKIREARKKKEVVDEDLEREGKRLHKEINEELVRTEEAKKMENPEIAELKKGLLNDLKKLDESSGEELEDWIKIVSSIFSRPQTLEYIKMRLDDLTSPSYLPERDNVRIEMKRLFSEFIERCQELLNE